MGMKLAQVSLSYGVDDIDGMVIEEKIYHMAGAKTPQQMAMAELRAAIREAGREPVQRDSLYRPVKCEERREKSETTVSERITPEKAGETSAPLYAGASNEGGVA